MGHTTTDAQLRAIERQTRLTPERFKKEYLDTGQPVILMDFMDDWPAAKKWDFDFFKENYGNIKVPLFSNDTSKPGKGYMTPVCHKPFSEYMEMLQAGPTELRMFLFNILKEVPELMNDLKAPTITKGFVKEYPFMFFGGKGSEVKLHYDVDFSSVFLNQFGGRKHVILFPPTESRKLYRQPFTVNSHVHPLKPNFEKYPASRDVQGFECLLEPGETLFIPSRYWHYIYYTDASFSLSLRANPTVLGRAIGIMSIVQHYVVDRGMNKIFGEHWHNLKENLAEKRAMN